MFKRVDKRNCTICAGTMETVGCPWCFRCATCKHWEADLEGFDINASSYSLPNAETFETFSAVRDENYEIIWSEFYSQLGASSSNPLGLRVLDVGCGSGRFLNFLGEHGVQPFGVEISSSFAKLASHYGKVFNQSFETLKFDQSKDELFDGVFFNDVFEHIVDARGTLDRITAILKPDGLLVLNCPASSGWLFLLSRVLLKFGWESPFKRLWQVGSYTPHVHYYSEKNLSALASQYGFAHVASKKLKVYSIKGLWSRLGIAEFDNLLLRALLWSLLVAIYPLVSLLPSDSVVSIFRVGNNDN